MTGHGTRRLLGGEGADVAVYSDSPDGVTIFLDDTNLIVRSRGHAEGDILVGIEAVTGSGHDDLLDGTNNLRTNWLSGASEDALWGGGHDHAATIWTAHRRAPYCSASRFDCTAPGFLDTSLGYAAWRSSYSSRASSGVR